MPQDKHPLLDTLIGSVFATVCCAIQQLSCSRNVAGGKNKERKGERTADVM